MRRVRTNPRVILRSPIPPDPDTIGRAVAKPSRRVPCPACIAWDTLVTVVVHQSREFATWLRSIRDDMVAARIVRRLERVQVGVMGDARSVGAGLHELRIDHGPGYRIYFQRWRNLLIVLLCGGDKSTQARDIATAKKLSKEWSDQDD